MLKSMVKAALRDLTRGLPGQYHRLEGELEKLSIDAQLEFVSLARNIRFELLAAERRGATKAIRHGRG
jgi:hypothetical protein